MYKQLDFVIIDLLTDFLGSRATNKKLGPNSHNCLIAPSNISAFFLCNFDLVSITNFTSSEVIFLANQAFL